jgi:hypothetical protein
MTASRNQRNFPQSLRVEPLEDRLLLSNSSAPLALFNDIAVPRSASRALAAPASGHQDWQIGQVHSFILGPSENQRRADHIDTDRYEEHEEFAKEWREHAALESGRIARAETTAANLLISHDTALPLASVAPAPIQAKAESADKPLTPSAPTLTASDVAWFVPRDGTSSFAAHDSTFSNGFLWSYEEIVPIREDAAGERTDADSLVLLEPARNVESPVGVIPLLDKLSFDLSGLRWGVDELLGRLARWQAPCHISWASTSCAVWLAVLTGIAMESARRWRVNTRADRAALAMSGWAPENYVPDEPT